jgi:adenylate kinase family enzyme
MLTGILFFPYRWIHPASGRIYSYSYKAPKVYGKDDITGEDLIQRPDDNPDKVRNRLEAYEEVRNPNAFVGIQQ